MSVLDKKVSGEHVMLLGFGMCAYGLWFKEYWFEIGGFMLFLAGIATLAPIRDEKEEGGLQGEGDGPENPLGRPPS